MVLFDTPEDALVDGAAADPEVITVNLEEFGFWYYAVTGEHLPAEPTDDQLVTAIRRIRPRRLTVITLGPAGRIAHQDGEVWRLTYKDPFKDEDLVSAVGAGDAGAGGFLTGITQIGIQDPLTLDPDVIRYSLELAMACSWAALLQVLPGHVDGEVVRDVLANNIRVRSWHVQHI